MRSGFSLLELIAVIAVMTILMAAGVSLMGDSGAKARRATTDLVMGMVEQGRSQAITSNSQVLLAFAEPRDVAGNKDERARLGLFKITKLDKNTGEATGVMLRRWEVVNTGVAFIGGQAGGFRNIADDVEVNLSYTSGGKSLATKVSGIIFNSRGGRDWPPSPGPVVVRIAEGGYRGEMKSASPNYRGESRHVIEDRVKIGRVIARPQRFDP